MGFLGVYRAIYDYAPQGEGELTISEGDILYVLEKSGEDDWWRAKKKASGDDEDEPVGLIPNNYIEEATPTIHARALFDYSRQTDEELSFSEDAQLEVYDTSDPDWILVGLDGEYGFAPSNYIDLAEAGEVSAGPVTSARPPALPQRDASPKIDHRAESPQETQSPAAALAGILSGRKASTPAAALPPRPQFTPDASDEDERPIPSLPQRPQSQSFSNQSTDYSSPDSPRRGVATSPPHTRVSFRERPDMDDSNQVRSPGGFHLYNISEMVSVMGKRKKMPTTFGINMATGKLMIAPEKARDGATQEWTAEKMTHYSIEGKHVFLELIRPSKSVDFHAGAKDTAQEIVSALGELAGAVRAEEGLREVYMAGSSQGQKKGVMLYDFMAQGDDEVSVAVDDEVIIIDDTKSDEWWQVRRLKNGKEGVVPSSYVEVTGVTLPPTSSAGVNAGKSTVEQNRLEEQRLTKEAAKDTRGSEVGPGMRLPERGSSLSAGDLSNINGQQRKGRGQPDPTRSKAKPDPTKIRTWTDRSKSFSVEAQFLALKDGKINLHKLNGVKIAVPVVKMSVEDLEYVERITGVSLDEDKPLSDIKGRKQRQSEQGSSSVPAPTIGASIEQPKKPEYDWFQFFLDCDVAVGVCERYAQVFHRDSMDESVLSDVDATVLRNLGLREGDILKVMRHLDQKYGRTKRNVSFNGEANGEGDGDSAGGLFSGAGGALRNNTRKGRPAPAVQTSDVIDPKAFSQGTSTSATAATPTASAPTPLKKDGPGGFDDDAWDVKPTKQQPQTNSATASQLSRPQMQQPTLTGSMQDLSLLSQPLEPTKIQPVIQQAIQQPIPQQQPPAQQASQPTGATPSFFAGVNQQQTGQQQQPPSMNGSFNQNQQFAGQLSQYGQPLQTQQNIARQRPMAPQQYQSQNTLMIPPPPRPLSAPQTAQQSAFGPPPLQPQMTGLPNSAFQPSPLAPPGQSLAEINQMRMQQQYDQQQQQMQQQMTGFGGQQGMAPQQTGFGQFNPHQQNGSSQQMQSQQTGFNQMQGSPFADPRNQQFAPVQQQPTNFQSQYSAPQPFTQQTGINTFLPPALTPQKTAMQPQQTGMNGFGQPSQNFVPPPIPPMPQQNTIAPLIPQKTGPPPPVRFGVAGDTKKLMPQATGRRANLAAATPQNPFGF